jgi:iron(III) transport system ATP-binding protein
MHVSIQNLSKRFGRTSVLKGVSLEIQDQELFFLLGPSGCGKTTLLRIIAGFYQPDSGELRFGDRQMGSLPPHRRNTGMVFQNYALWPHMTVFENVAYGLEVRAVSAGEKKERVARALAIVQMGSYADRTPNQLSGGQQQRVALARALVINPDVLLLDEPLSNLDARLRLEMREEIRRIHAQTRITTIYVTHDQKESLSLADRIAVMREGVIEQVGDPRTIYRAPANRFVADFIGETNWLLAKIVSRSETGVRLKTDFAEFEASAQPLPATDTVWLGFRPEAVEFGSTRFNSFSATISQVSYLGETEQYELRVSSTVTLKAIEQNPRAIRCLGGAVTLQVHPENLLLLPIE